MTDYLPRELTGRITRAMRTMPVVVLSGMRQTGKSTMLQCEDSLSAGRVYHTLDDFATLAAARSSPHSLLGTSCIVDEVQRCPELLLAIKQEVDRDRLPGRFLLSGSANLSLLSSVAETLAGRALYVALHPMTRREIRGRTNAEPFIVRWLADQSMPGEPAEPITPVEVLSGGLPPACLSDNAGRDDWFRGYVQTYIERDVRQIAAVGDAVAFHRVAQLAALRTGQVLVVSSLGRDAGLKAATTGRYLDLLETSFVVRRLPPFVRSRSARLIKSPKPHYTDSGLAAHMAGVRDLSAEASDSMRGHLFETYVLQNLSAILETHAPDARLSYWHEQGRHEVDIVVEAGREVMAIEVKTAERWDERDLSSLRAFLRATPQCTSAVLAYNGTRAVPLGDRLYAIPMGHLIA